ncbi:UNVERIFIED_CONTAM: hypothetical protein Sindi_1494900 [Sesamum indicum]
MNYSIFSSFDAVCAELLGYSVTAPRSGPPKSADGIAKKIDHVASAKQVRPKTKGSKTGGVSAAPRLAPELDGLNCFETLVS